jgi:Holliday junction resolvase
MAKIDRAIPAEAEFERVLADLFRKARWRVHRAPTNGDTRPDLVAEVGNKKYVIKLKVSSEGRRDRLIPLLSQAILQAQAFARWFPEPAVPVAVVAASRIPASVAEQIKQFAERNAPDVGIGVMDAAGLRAFWGHGLERFDAKPARRERGQIASPPHLPNLFSDLNQWMLKILLGQHLPETLLKIPRAPFRNASQLATAANVSVMSAFRFVSQLAQQGFLGEDEEHLRIVRVEELLERWVSANRQAWEEIPARWIIKKGPQQLRSVLREYASPPDSGPTKKRKRRSAAHIELPRCCAGLFAAADILGLGFVHGVPPHIYIERLTLDSLNRLGLMAGRSDRPADVYIRIPARSEAIFRALVLRQGVPVTDILQVWIDASTYPARGREQANEIRRRLLGPLFGKKKR